MTTGIDERGYKTSVTTSVGSGVEYIHYSKKTWAGGDRSPGSVGAEYVSIPRARRVLVVRDGVRLKEVVWKSKLKRVRRKTNPLEVLADLHGYSMTYQFKTDRVLTEVQTSPQGTVFERTMTGVQSSYGTAHSGDFPGFSSNDEIALIGKLRNRIAGSSFNLGVSLAEASPALRMITSSATRLYRAYKFARRGKLKAAADALTDGLVYSDKKRKVTARNWLELQYGWLPLLCDVEDAAKWLAQYLEFPRVERYRARSFCEGDLVPSIHYNGVKGKIRWNAQLIGYVREVNETKLVGLQDPLSVAWELLPYSFVLDWFIPVQNYLSARALSSAIHGGFVKTVTDRTYSRTTGELFDSANGWTLSTRGLYTELRDVSVVRTVMSSLEVPLPQLKQLSSVPSWRRAANSVALLVNLKRF